MMKVKFKQLAGSIWPMLLLALSVTSAHAQDPKPNIEVDALTRTDRKVGEMMRQPRNSVRVEIRYNKEYGYQSQSGAFGGTGPTSCEAFAVDFKLESPVNQEKLMPITRESKMRESGGYYVCDFLVSELPFNQKITISASLGNERDSTEAWKGGSQPKPPEGLRRVIQEPSRTITLTDTKTRDTLSFEMVYAAPEPPAPYEIKRGILEVPKKP